MRICAIHSSSHSPSQYPPELPKTPVTLPRPPFTSNSFPRSSYGITAPASRRLLLSSFSLLLPYIHSPLPSSALDIGFSGPKEWLKEQKKKSAKFLLAPVDASRDILRFAYLLIAKDSDYEDKDLEEVQRLLRAAARDCIPRERNSFVAFQAKTGVEVCTFTLVFNNGSSLLDDTDPIKLEAQAILTDLLSSFSQLIGIASDSDIRFVSNRQKLGGAVMDTIYSLDKFEKGVRECLES